MSEVKNLNNANDFGYKIFNPDQINNHQFKN
jgi:hypothetical protein